MLSVMKFYHYISNISNIKSINKNIYIKKKNSK